MMATFEALIETVMPAKAGTQEELWIPAFAEMTIPLFRINLSF